MHVEQYILSIFLIFFVIQVLYICVVDTQLLFFKEPNISNEAPPVSVIVASHNDHEHLPALIASILQQDYPNFELIIIDDRSFPPLETYVDLAKYTASDNVKMIRIDTEAENITGKKNALTTAIEQALYEHLLFTDADCLPASDQWIKGMVHSFDADTDIVLGVSPYFEEGSLLNKVIQCETLYTFTQYLSLSLLKMPYMGVGRNLAYRKSLFKKVNGYNQHNDTLGGDDDLFVGAHATYDNTNISISSDTFVKSYPKVTWKTWFRQKYRHIGVSKHYKNLHKIVLGLHTLSHVGLWGVGMLGFFSTILPYNWTILLLLIFRVFLKNLLLYNVASKVKLPTPFLNLIFFDFFYSIYIVILGISTILFQPKKWR